MKKEIAEKWVAALRSGKYKQGKGALCINKRFCCLGVLCETLQVPYRLVTEYVAGPDGRPKKQTKRAYAGNLEDGQAWTGTPAPSVASAAGMACSNPSVNVSGITGSRSSLAELNDYGGKTFTEIADIIEKNWEKL